MSSNVSYKGRYLGAIRLDDTNTRKWVFTAENLGSLETLFKMGDEEVVELEGVGEMSYRDFKERHLKDISGFYSTTEAWFLKDYPHRTIEEWADSAEKGIDLLLKRDSEEPNNC